MTSTPATRQQPHEALNLSPNGWRAAATNIPLTLDELRARSTNDPERLAALYALGILDAPPEAALDRLSALAARLLKVPTALVSLVEQDRQFFASAVGLGAPWEAQRGTPISHSVCQYVVALDSALSVEDMREHAYLHNHPAIADIGVIGYLGTPIHAPNGQPIGSFCAIDGVPHTWTSEDMATVRDLAAIAGSLLALRAACAERDALLTGITSPPPADTATTTAL